jgi:hypothetical protein
MKRIEEGHRSFFLLKRTPITARGRSHRGEPVLLPWLSAVSDGRSDPKVPGGTHQVIQLHLAVVAFIRSLPSSSASTSLALGE